MDGAVASSTTVLGLLVKLINAILPDDGKPNYKSKSFAENVVNTIEGVFNDLAASDKALAHSARAEAAAARRKCQNCTRNWFYIHRHS